MRLNSAWELESCANNFAVTSLGVASTARNESFGEFDCDIFGTGKGPGDLHGFETSFPTKLRYYVYMLLPIVLITGRH